MLVVFFYLKCRPDGTLAVFIGRYVYLKHRPDGTQSVFVGRCGYLTYGPAGTSMAFFMIDMAIKTKGSHLP